MSSESRPPGVGNREPEFKYRSPGDVDRPPFDWGKAIEEAVSDKNYEPILNSLTPGEQGSVIHEWLENEFGDQEFLTFEEDVGYYDEDGEYQVGTYDCFDGNYVYEFKTKSPHLIDLYDDPEHEAELPLDGDIDQITDYLEAKDVNYGVLVYIERDEFEVREFLIERGQEPF